MRFDVEKNLVTELGADGLGKKVTCKDCCSIVFEVPDAPTDSQRLAEGKKLVLHLELFHDMVGLYGRCNDQTCDKYHLVAFHKDAVPPGFLEKRSHW